MLKTTVIALCMAVALPLAFADRQPANPKKDKRESTKAALRLERAVAAKCDSGDQHRGREYRKVMAKIRSYCGSNLPSGCSIEGEGDSYVLHKLDDKKKRTSSDSKRYPSDFKSVLVKYCKD